MRPFCEDGRSFIRSVFNRAFDGPFRDPPPKKNSAQLRQERRKKFQEERERKRSPERFYSSPPPAPRRRRITQFAMNLPESAIEFLDEFRGVLASANGGERALSGLYGAEDSEAMPMIHCYCFTRELEPEKAEIDIRQVRSIPYLTIVDVANAGTSAICCHREWRTSWDIRSGRRHHTTGCGQSLQAKRCTVSVSGYLTQWRSLREDSPAAVPYSFCSR